MAGVRRDQGSHGVYWRQDWNRADSLGKHRQAVENPEAKQLSAERGKKNPEQGQYTVLISFPYVSTFLTQIHTVIIWKANILFGTLFLKREIYIWISILTRKQFKVEF